MLDKCLRCSRCMGIDDFHNRVSCRYRELLSNGLLSERQVSYAIDNIPDCGDRYLSKYHNLTEYQRALKEAKEESDHHNYRWGSDFYHMFFEPTTHNNEGTLK